MYGVFHCYNVIIKIKYKNKNNKKIKKLKNTLITKTYKNNYYTNFSNNKIYKKIYKTIEYYKNGILCEESYYKYGVLHRIEKPANIFYYKNGIARYKSYYINGKLHRESDINGNSQPAIIEYYKNKNYLSNIYYKYGNFFRKFNLPEIIHYNKDGTIDEEIFWNDIKHNNLHISHF